MYLSKKELTLLLHLLYYTHRDKQLENEDENLHSQHHHP
jgi:hypothetical protein